MRDASILLERAINPMAVDVPGISCNAGVSRESAELVLRPPGSFALCLVSHRPLKGCARQCPGRAGKESCPFTRFNPVLQIPSRMLALGICLLLNFLSFILEILSFREDLEPCKGTCLCSYDQTLKKCLSFIFRGVIQEMEIDLLMRQRASRNVLVVFNVL